MLPNTYAGALYRARARGSWAMQCGSAVGEADGSYCETETVEWGIYARKTQRR